MAAITLVSLRTIWQGCLDKLTLLANLISGGKIPVSGPLTDTELRASSVSITLNGSLSKVVIQDCTAANTEYTIDVNTLLSKNGRGGFVKAKSSNSGEVSVCFSQDGTTFGTYIPDIQPGEAISLDGIDLDSIKVKSTVAGEDIIVEVH